MGVAQVKAFKATDGTLFEDEQAAPPAQVEQNIGDQLSRPVIRHLTTSVRLHDGHIIGGGYNVLASTGLIRQRWSNAYFTNRYDIRRIRCWAPRNRGRAPR